MKENRKKIYKEVYMGRRGVCTVLRPGNDLLIFEWGLFETCTFIYNPVDASIRMRTEIREGNQIRYMNEGWVCEIGSLPEEEQYFFCTSAKYMLWTIEEEIEKDMKKRLEDKSYDRDCSDCYIDYKAIHEIINTMKKHISPLVLQRALFDTGNVSSELSKKLLN
jgi:hypothetical protein